MEQLGRAACVRRSCRSPLTLPDCATFDYADGTKRAGDRAVGIGEKPFFNPKSLSRREALALEGSPF